MFFRTLKIVTQEIIVSYSIRNKLCDSEHKNMCMDAFLKSFFTYENWGVSNPTVNHKDDSPTTL